MNEIIRVCIHCGELHYSSYSDLDYTLYSGFSCGICGAYNPYDDLNIVCIWGDN